MQDLFMYLLWSCSGAKVEFWMVLHPAQTIVSGSSWLDGDTQLKQVQNSSQVHHRLCTSYQTNKHLCGVFLKMNE